MSNLAKVLWGALIVGVGIILANSKEEEEPRYKSGKLKPIKLGGNKKLTKYEEGYMDGSRDNQ
jgi:hypothetical protein